MFLLSVLHHNTTTQGPKLIPQVAMVYLIQQ